jgi:hypothetical protein
MLQDYRSTSLKEFIINLWTLSISWDQNLTYPVCFLHSLFYDFLYLVLLLSLLFEPFEHSFGVWFSLSPLYSAFGSEMPLYWYL